MPSMRTLKRTGRRTAKPWNGHDCRKENQRAERGSATASTQAHCAADVYSQSVVGKPEKEQATCRDMRAAGRQSVSANLSLSETRSCGRGTHVGADLRIADIDKMQGQQVKAQLPGRPSGGRQQLATQRRLIRGQRTYVLARGKERSASVSHQRGLKAAKGRPRRDRACPLRPAREDSLPVGRMTRGAAQDKG